MEELTNPNINTNPDPPMTVVWIVKVDERYYINCTECSSNTGASEFMDILVTRENLVYCSLETPQQIDKIVEKLQELFVPFTYLKR